MLRQILEKISTFFCEIRSVKLLNKKKENYFLDSSIITDSLVLIHIKVFLIYSYCGIFTTCAMQLCMFSGDIDQIMQQRQRKNKTLYILRNLTTKSLVEHFLVLFKQKASTFVSCQLFSMCLMYLPFGNHLFSFKMITLKVKVKK